MPPPSHLFPDEALCRACFDASPDLFFYKDIEGYYRFVNRAFLDLLEISREDAIGHTDADMFPPESAIQHREADRQVLRTGRPDTFEYSMPQPGRTLWLEVLKSPVRDSRGTIVGFFCTARNITYSKEDACNSQRVQISLEQRVADRTRRLRQVNTTLRRHIKERHNAEKALADSVRTLNLILDNSPIGISFVSRRVVQWANPRFHDLFAMSAGSISGLPTSMFYPNQEAYEAFGKIYYPKLARGERVDTVLPMRRSDGTTFFCRIIGQLLYSDHPQQGSIWLMEDVTERQIAREATLAAGRLKREFMNTMSHEIRTPLNGIQGMATLLAATSLNEEQRAYVQDLHESTQAITELFEGILEFSRLEAGTARVDKAPFRPRSIVQSLVQSQSRMAQEKGISLTGSTTPEVPELLLGDGNRVRRVLVALLSNAIKFTEYGAVSLTIECSALQGDVAAGGEDQPYVELTCTVTDTGIGLTDEQRITIFEPFRQVDGSRTRSFGGTGLGLAIARQIVVSMGGSITVESKPGHGSRFIVTIPFFLCQEEPDRAP